MYNSRKRNKVTGAWSDLHLDLLLLVVRKIDSVQDYFAFRGVCTGWRLAASYEHDFNQSAHELPLLLETSNEGLNFSTPLATQQSHSISTIANVVAVLSQEMDIRHCLGCRGWLLVVQVYGYMDLVHVMSGARIILPPLENSFDCKFQKMILSSSPLTNPSNFTLVIVYDYGMMAYWRPGDKTFTELQSPPVFDVIYSSTRGVFYGLSIRGCLLSIEGNNHEYPTTLAVRKMYPIRSLPKSPSLYWRLDKFLVESDGDLLLVVQHEGKVENLVRDEILGRYYKVFAFHFHIYKIEELVVVAGYEYGDECRMTEIKNLGNRALFVGGLGASISVNASNTPGCKPNHIYYTGHSHEGKITHAMYNLADGLIDPSGCGVFSEKNSINYPSLWVTPTFV